MAALPAIRHIAPTAKSALGYIHMQCHVKPGARKQREGILSISDSVIEVCVSAQPKDGEAIKAVREVFSSVSNSIIVPCFLMAKLLQALKCPKSDVEVIRGLKSRDKTIAVAGVDAPNGDVQGCIERIKGLLQSAIE